MSKFHLEPCKFKVFQMDFNQILEWPFRPFIQEKTDLGYFFNSWYESYRPNIHTEDPKNTPNTKFRASLMSILFRPTTSKPPIHSRILNPTRLNQNIVSKKRKRRTKSKRNRKRNPAKKRTLHRSKLILQGICFREKLLKKSVMKSRSGESSRWTEVQPSFWIPRTATQTDFKKLLSPIL